MVGYDDKTLKSHFEGLHYTERHKSYIRGSVISISELTHKNDPISVIREANKNFLSDINSKIENLNLKDDKADRPQSKKLGVRVEKLTPA